MVLKENKRFVKRFAQYEEKSLKDTSSSSNYGYGSSYYHRYDGVPKEFQTTIFFYEWSDMRKGSKSFYDKRKFKDFLLESKISVSSELMAMIDNKTYLYSTCYPGKSELMIEDTYFKLETALKKAKGIETTTPPHTCNSYDRNWDAYDEWGCRDAWGNCHWD